MYDSILTSDTAPGTAASNAKAADAKSCSFILIDRLVVSTIGWITDL